MTELEFPAPPSLILPFSPADDAVRAAVALIESEVGQPAADQPLFLAIEPCPAPGSPSPPPCAGTARISYLGLTESAGTWLETVAGLAFANECAVALRRSLLGHDHGWPLPADLTGQVIAAARLLRARVPGAPLRLAFTPLGFGTGSGSGLAHSADPVTGLPGAVGEFRAGATGSQLLDSGGSPIASLRPEPWLTELRALLATAEERAGHPIRVEFAVTGGRLWIVSARPSARRGAALVRAAARAAAAARTATGARTAPAATAAGSGTAGSWAAVGAEVPVGQIVASVPEHELASALAPHAEVHGLIPVARGLGVSRGIAHGQAVFSAADAVRTRADGLRPVLLLDETRPEDIDGLLAAAAVVTQRGGYTSHAAVVTRGLGMPCVTALSGGVTVRDARLLLDDGTCIRERDEITVDGSTGQIYLGASAANGNGTGSGHADGKAFEVAGDVAAAAAELLAEAGKIGGLAVRVNADSAVDAVRGAQAGATGVGLCRIEHMLLGERKQLLEQLLLSPSGSQAARVLDRLRELLRADLTAILLAMDGMPVAVRLLDPPRHEFLPSPAGPAAGQQAPERDRCPPDPRQAAALARLSERNPMLGVRGVRLNLLMMDLAAAQLQALAQAAVAARRAGGTPRPELLVPMVAAVAEFDAIRALLTDTIARAGSAAGRLEIPVGAMIETPRAALLAGELAKRADFFSIGTNDLTALVWGLSRDDAEAELLPAYAELGIIGESPFSEFDAAGVGVLVRQSVESARAVNPALQIGVCGEQAASGRAVSFFARIGIDYVSCAPPLVPVARLACARTALRLEER
jgi:pyruvate,orthophosphate dikinase